MIRHLCLNYLLCPTFSLCQQRLLFHFYFNKGWGVQPCQVFPGHSTILANGLALSCTMEVTILAECPQSLCMGRRQWCCTVAKDLDTCRYPRLDLDSLFLSQGVSTVWLWGGTQMHSWVPRVVTDLSCWHLLMFPCHMLVWMSKVCAWMFPSIWSHL